MIETESWSTGSCEVVDRSHNSPHEDYSICRSTVIDRQEPFLALQLLIDQNARCVAHFHFSATIIQLSIVDHEQSLSIRVVWYIDRWITRFWPSSLRLSRWGWYSSNSIATNRYSVSLFLFHLGSGIFHASHGVRRRAPVSQHRLPIAWFDCYSSWQAQVKWNRLSDLTQTTLWSYC